MEGKSLKKIKEELAGAGKIAVSGHVRPDGDCVGAVLSMYGYLKKAFPKVQADVYLEKPAGHFAFLKGFDEIDSAFLKQEVYDVFICLDTAKDRLGGAQKYFDQAAKTICIDHHVSNTGSADVDYIVPEASSTSELVYEVIEEEFVDRDIAEAVYVGMVHDTGIFQYSNTSQRTMELAGKLITYGFDFPGIIGRTFHEKTYIQNQILGRALLESMLLLGGRCIVSGLDKKTMDFYGVGPTDLSGIVNQLKNTAGVDCAVFIYETGTLEHKVSLRTSKYVDAVKIVKNFGGGGHVRAAGCTMSGTFHDVVNNLSLHIEKQLQECGRC